MLPVALVGFGWWGRTIASRLKENSLFELVCVVEPNADAHSDIIEMGLTPILDFNEAVKMENVRALILTSPNDLHDQQIAQSVAEGKHVFCEKPLSLTFEGASNSVKACEEAGLVLGIGHERRFEPAVMEIKRLLNENAFGNIMHAELAFSHDKLINLPAGSWRTSKTFAPAAGMTQMGIHLTDILIWYFGKVKSVYANTSSRSLGWETGDVVVVQLLFEAGMTANIQAILHTPHFLRTHIFGSEMWAEVRNSTHPDETTGVADLQVYRSLEDTKTTRYDWADSVSANLENWRSAIVDGTEYLNKNFEMMHNIEVLNAIIKSAEDGEVVRLS
ncbi:MAG: Gfo/Idh/MocA family oxidoreductase [Alphaproteobacteria bacterium]